MMQISLFEEEVTSLGRAVSLFDNKATALFEPDASMKKLVPEGVYVVYVGKHPLVLRKMDYMAEDVPASHRFYHYEIGGSVYSGIFVGEMIS